MLDIWQVKVWELSGGIVAHYYRNLLRRYGRSPQALAERSDHKETQFYNHRSRRKVRSGGQCGQGWMVSRVFQYEHYIAYCIRKMMKLSRAYVIFNLITDVDFSLGNYKRSNQIGHITYIPRDTLITIIEQQAGLFNATFAIHETKIYPDATDAFVWIKLV